MPLNDQSRQIRVPYRESILKSACGLAAFLMGNSENEDETYPFMHTRNTSKIDPIHSGLTPEAHLSVNAGDYNE